MATHGTVLAWLAARITVTAETTRRMASSATGSGPDVPLSLLVLALVICLNEVQVFVQLPSEPCVVGEPCHENLIRLTAKPVECEAATRAWTNHFNPRNRLGIGCQIPRSCKYARNNTAAHTRTSQTVPVHLGHDLAGYIPNRTP